MVIEASKALSDNDINPLYPFVIVVMDGFPKNGIICELGLVTILRGWAQNPFIFNRPLRDDFTH